MTYEEYDKALNEVKKIQEKALTAIISAEDELEFAKEDLEKAEEEYEKVNNRLNDLLSIDKSTLRNDSKQINLILKT